MLLPAHHLPRQRLLAELTRSQVGLVVAGGGYGKSVLGVELAEALGLATVVLALGPDDSQAASFVARIVAALRRARLADCATAVRAAAGDPSHAVDTLVEALGREREPVLVVVDDAHVLGEQAAAALVQLARDLPGGHRLVVLARDAEGRLAGLARAATSVVGPAQLAFTPDEVGRLAAACGVELDPSGARSLQHATAGWAAALVLALDALGRAERPEHELDQIVAQKRPLRYLVHRQLEALEAQERAAIVQLSHLPLLSPQLAGAVSGDENLLASVTAAGIPLSRRADGWSELPGPVQELLRRLAPLEAATALAASEVYAAAGELAQALHVLIAAGLADDAARVLAAVSPQEADDLGFFELQTLVDAVPSDALDRNPRVLLHLARTCEPAAQTKVRAAALERGIRLVEHSKEQALQRELLAEQARDLVRDGHAGEAETLARSLLAVTGADELATRARLVDVLGRAAAWRRDDRSLAEAELLLREAQVLCTRLGQRAWAAQVVLPLAIAVYFVRGLHDRALECIETGLADLPARSAHRGVLLSFYSDVLVDCGRYAEAEAALAEEKRLGAVLGDYRISAYAYWTSARLGAQSGDRRRVVEEVSAVDSFRHDWFEQLTGVTFLAESAEFLARVGEHERAGSYLEAARARRVEGPLTVAMGEVAVLARTGDPIEALRILDEVEAMPRLVPRDRWRRTLLRAWCELRAGDHPAATRDAVAAFELAASLGDPGLARVRERELCEGLIELAVEAGSPAAARLAGDGGKLSIRTLGGFELRRGGDGVDLPAGKPEQLVKLLAVSGGRLPADVAIEALWPDAESQSGRKRLRNVLNRLHAVVPDVVRRAGDVLELGDVEVDAQLFEREARSVLSDGERGGGRARSAIARYSGELLPDDRYAEWAAVPRERLDRLFVAVVETAARAARATGDLDEAIRCNEAAIEREPYEERRYLLGARMLLEQGRRGAALAVLDRGARALAELGARESDTYRELVAAIRS
ncbi:MAG TPA: BTAD domain-containing putative transcriptional regulator [Acidimicrobiales bacterium]|nr:BTAD domain-containing putative transcriptional regulator [Acidimicrobiales bacterium]